MDVGFIPFFFKPMLAIGVIMSPFLVFALAEYRVTRNSDWMNSHQPMWFPLVSGFLVFFVWIFPFLAFRGLFLYGKDYPYGVNYQELFDSMDPYGYMLSLQFMLVFGARFFAIWFFGIEKARIPRFYVTITSFLLTVYPHFFFWLLYPFL